MTIPAHSLPEGYFVNPVEVTPELLTFNVGTEGANLSGYLYRPTGECVLHRVDVVEDMRRKHVANRLVRLATDYVTREGARFLVASLTSRESVTLMQRVFGEDTVTIEQLGDFAPKGMDTCPGSPTKASFRTEIKVLPKED